MSSRQRESGFMLLFPEILQMVRYGDCLLYTSFTASVMEQEQNAGDFQNLLSLPDKPAADVYKRQGEIPFKKIL